ncbi:DEAD/DEAH box helicase [Candidatus Woesearchaeota archaeon]|nr:DEAD/DEAH box helicase [Candidatus Woesearchaeota archaeon]
MIKGFEPRLYQQTIFASAAKYNTLVVLPTGMGKTNIFLLLAAQRLKQYPKSKILLIGPTRPLIDQYLRVFQDYFDMDHEKYAIFTGHVQPKKREELWNTCQIFFSTPQGLENDIISGRIKLEEVTLLGVDEAHRAVGDYAYVFVAKQYMKKARHPRILGLTASPGSDMEKITEVVQNLHIEEIEVRTDEDPDVKQYIQEIDVKWVKVKLPPKFLDVKKYIDDFIKERLKKLKEWGILHRADTTFVSKKDLIGLQAQLRGRAASGEKDFVMWNAISLLAEIMKVQHALELLETQGVKALHTYLNKLEREAYSTKVKAVKNLVKDLNFRSALIKCQTLFDERAEHPKLVELQNMVDREQKKNKDIKMIVFNQYRDNAQDIVEKLNIIPGIKANLFIGQQKRSQSGLSQKKQKEMLDEFREGKFNVLVATSVGEEGLDIPRVDLVIFFEPIPSAIRHIQRRGRTGRQEKGRVIILMAEDTRDVGYKWAAHHKEKRMYRNLGSLKQKLKTVLNVRRDTPLTRFVQGEKVKIFVDHREKGSPVIKQLVDMDADLKIEQMDVDYLLSERVAVEFKTVEDFAQSIIDGRLMEQVRELKKKYARPLIIIEGKEDIYSVRNIHANAIRGMLSNIVVSYGVPLLQTKSPIETANLLYVIAKREQDDTSKDFMPHTGKRVADTKWLQEYIISALPGIGATLAKPLLKQFKSISKIVNASVDELKEVEGIGKVKAEEIRRILDEEY